MHTWRETEHRLHLLGGNAGRRIQLLIALVVMLLVAIQLLRANHPGSPGGM